MDFVLPRKKTLGAVFAAGVVVAAAAAALLLWQGLPNGRAAPADAPPLSQVPQVAIPDSDMAALAQLRDAVQDEPHAIDASLNQRILAGKLDGLIGGALSPSQRDILSDGVITFAEYQKAETAWHVCMANAGLSVPPMHLNGVALFNQSIISGPSREGLDSEDARCSHEYTGAIELVWSQVVASLGSKMAQIQRQALSTCVAHNPAYTAHDCMIAVSNATDTTGFFGNNGSSPPPPP